MENGSPDRTGFNFTSHPQISFLSEQIDAARKEWQQQREILEGHRLLLERERIAREAGEQSLKQAVDELRGVVQFESSARDSGYRDLSKQISSCFANTKDVDDRRESSSVSLQSSIKMIAQSIGDERKQRELSAENLEKYIGAVQKQCESLLAEAQEALVAARTQLATCQSTLEASEAEYRAASGNAKQEIQRIQHAIALEKSEHTAAIAGAQADSAEMLRNTVREFQDSLNSVRLDVRNSQGEVEVRVTRVTEAMKDEATMRASKLDDVLRLMDALKHSIEQEKQDRELSNATTNRFGQDLSRRCEDEAQVREAEFARLFRLVQEETEVRQEELRKLTQHVSFMEEVSREELAAKQREFRELSHTIEETKAAVKAERAERMLRMDDVNDQVNQSKGILAQEQETLAADREAFTRTAKKVDDLKETLDENVKELRGVTDTASSRLKELSSQLSQTRAALNKDHELLKTEREARVSAAQEWEETREKFQQRFKALADGTSKLREECKEAILREVRARTKHQTALEEAVKETVKETKGRAEDGDQLQNAVESVKKELEDAKLDFEKKLRDVAIEKSPPQVPVPPSNSSQSPDQEIPERERHPSSGLPALFMPTQGAPELDAGTVTKTGGDELQDRAASMPSDRQDSSFSGDSPSGKQDNERQGRRRSHPRLPRPYDHDSGTPLDPLSRPRRTSNLSISITGQ